MCVLENENLYVKLKNALIKENVIDSIQKHKEE